MAAAAAILDFQNFKILTVGTIKRDELHHRPPSWICDACVGTTHEGHLAVFITLQNLVEIDAVVLIMCTFFDSLVWLDNAYARPQNWDGGGLTPK